MAVVVVVVVDGDTAVDVDDDSEGDEEGGSRQDFLILSSDTVPSNKNDKSSRGHTFRSN